MVGSLLEGRPQTRRPPLQAAASENVLAFGNNEFWRSESELIDPTQCDAHNRNILTKPALS
jgi:hypothetical protein